MSYKYLFGPIPSRRLGISLGIDLLPEKICSFNCVYCECNKTIVHTQTRKEYTPTKDVIAELKNYFENEEAPDYVTFSGSGEPTLHTGIGEIIRFLKTHFPAIKVALLTNATLLSNPDVRKEISPLDLVLPTINGAIEASFMKVSRPIKGIKLDNVVAGLIQFRKEFTGKIWLSYFVLEGLNTNMQELEKLAEIVQKIQPDVLQLNSLDRPGSESWVKPAPKKLLDEIQEFLNNKLNHKIPVEIISRSRSHREIQSYREDIEASILNILSRRPCTIEDLSESLGVHISEIAKYIDVISKEGKISVQIEPRGVFYVIK